MRRWAFVVVLSLSLVASVPQAAHAKAKQYQVTGTVEEVTDSLIVVMKGKEKFEIDRDADTKVDGDLKVGSKVTVYYTMTAAKIEAKGASDKKDDAKK